MNVTVLCGGPSVEREVSLVSGTAVAEGLRQAGHAVHVADIGPDNLSALDRRADVIFPVLHGTFGESGELQEILEQRAVAFVGSGSAASRLGMDKTRTKQVWEEGGLPTPPWEVIEASTRDRIEHLTLPCVVKAPASGSSIDVYACRNRADAAAAVEKIIRAHGSALVERLIEGVELTIGFLEEKPLPPIRIETPKGFFDFEAKYKSKSTGYRFDTGLSADVIEQCAHLAQRAYRMIGCRDLARIDLIVEPTGQPFFLEINTLPGFTATSLLPKAAKQVGQDFVTVVDGLVRRALSRHQASQVSGAAG